MGNLFNIEFKYYTFDCIMVFYFFLWLFYMLAKKFSELYICIDDKWLADAIEGPLLVTKAQSRRLTFNPKRPVHSLHTSSTHIHSYILETFHACVTASFMVHHFYNAKYTFFLFSFNICF